MTELIPLGRPFTMISGIVYALPAVRCILFFREAGAVIEHSNTEDFAFSTLITFTNGQAELSGGFIACSGDRDITLKRG